MTRVPVKPELLHWACERAGVDVDALKEHFPKLPQWISRQAQPTLKQLEAFAKATRAPVGCFFLPEPPVEVLPIPDFRTMSGRAVARPSPDLLDTIYLCQQRQEWYRDFARVGGDRGPAFVGSARTTDDVVRVAAGMRRALGFDLQERRQLSTWEAALRRFIEQADELGVLVMVNGVVGSNNFRRLDPREFRGFTLSDPLAPLIFINGADTKAGQMFTIAHELAHLWLNQSALTDANPRSSPGIPPGNRAATQAMEDWCNRAAAELLVPLAALRQERRPQEPLQQAMDRLARQFKVSTLVILRRIYDAGGLSREAFWRVYDAELARLQTLPRASGGGDFYRTTAARVGKRFARAVVASAAEGRSSFTEAFRLLGFHKMATFHELGQNLGVLL